MVVSSDGLPIAASSGLDRDAVDRFSAVASGLIGLAYGAAGRFGGGAVTEVIVEMENAFLFVTGISDGSLLATMAEANADVGLVAYEMAVLVEKTGDVLTPELRAELQAALPPMTEEEQTGTAALRVRPYLLTGGRTKADVNLPLEAQVRTTDAAADNAVATLPPEKRSIIELCVKPHSVAEVSALLRTHLQVTRILIGDLITDGLIDTNAAATQSDERPDVRLLERVLDGLQSL